MQILINNIKIIGIFIAISLISIPILTVLWNIAENNGKFAFTCIITILFTVFTMVLYFLAGRFLVKGTGVLIYDVISLFAIIIIIFVGFILIPEKAIFFTYPHLLFIIIFNNQIVGTIISVAISLLTLLIGIITKSGIKRII